MVQRRDTDTVSFDSLARSDRQPPAGGGPLQLRTPRGRTLLLALAALVLCCGLIQYSEIVATGNLNNVSPTVGGVAGLLLLAAGINPLLGALRRRWSVTRGEMLLVYGLVLIAAPMASYWGARLLLYTIATPPYFASGENRWSQLILPHVPDWFGPRDPDVLRGFFAGSRAGVPWAAWVGPLAIWTALIMAVYLVLLCMAVLARRQWLESERLDFPVARLPLAMTAGRAGTLPELFRNPLMWCGFALPVALHTLNGLHVYYPSVPGIPHKNYDVGSAFVTPPWNAIGTFVLSFHPYIIGITYLVSAEISLSFWVFYLLSKAEAVWGGAMGWTGAAGSAMALFPFNDYQSAGAYVMLALIWLWLSRARIAGLMRVQRGRREARADPEERWAAVGLTAGLALIGVWCWAAGMGLGTAALFFGAFFLYAAGLARVRAEAGFTSFSGPLVPTELIPVLVGTTVLGAADLVKLAYLKFMTVQAIGFITAMGAQLETFKLADEARIPRGRVLAGSALAFAFVIGMTFALALYVFYRDGAAIVPGGSWGMGTARTIFNTTQSYLQNPRPPSMVNLQFAALGAAQAAVLATLRNLVPWWPLHPLGFAVAFGLRTVQWTWFSILLGWLCKVVVVHLGGVRIYQVSVPLFLGMILGDFFMAALWGLVGALLRSQGYGGVL